jgi:hypothetical protein
MYPRPTIVPLNAEDEIYALFDEKGVVIGTGTREVCEVLINILNRQALPPVSKETSPVEFPRTNIRPAIVIK